MSDLKFKGELCDGHVHMTAQEYVEKQFRNRMEQQKLMLKKLSGNPALHETYRKLLDEQINNINLLLYYRKAFNEANEVSK